MARKRNPENRSLPKRWVIKHGAYYFITSPANRHLWENKIWYRLGKTEADAYQTWAKRLNASPCVKKINDLFDQYLLEVVPNKAPKTQTENRRQIAALRDVFGHMKLTDLRTADVYRYYSKRTAKTAAKREIEVLSHAFTMAVCWDHITSHPFKKQLELKRPNGNGIRDRYVEDWEIVELMKLTPHRKKGSVAMIQAYIQLKLQTGLRQRDLLLLKEENLHSDGIQLIPSKTKGQTQRPVLYLWTDDLRSTVEQIKDVRPASSDYLFCNRFGESLVNMEKGTAGDWNNLWQHFMARVMKETAIKKRFTEHDLRAKVASDADNLEQASELMAHSNPQVTAKIYRRAPRRILPADSPLN